MNTISSDTQKAICLFRWSYPIYYMFEQSLGYCCRTPAQYVPVENMNQFGSSVFSQMTYFQDRRLEMLTGTKHSDCNSCWQLEDKKVKSPRSSSDIERQFKKTGLLPKEAGIEDIFKNENLKNEVISDASVDILEIVLSNVCNAKCVYCNEFYSTSWLAEKKLSNTVSKNYFDKKRNSQLDGLFWTWFDEKAISTVTRIGFIGGEPLLIPELYECLEKIENICKQRNFAERRPEICLTTNLSLNKLQLDKFIYWIEKMSGQFKFVIQISLEAPSLQTEYIRFGTKWDLISTNIEKLLVLSQKSDLEVSFLPTLNILAVPTMAEFINDIHNLHLKYKIPLKIISNTVTDPDILSPLLLSRSEVHFFEKAILEIDTFLEMEETSEKQKEYYQSYRQYLLEMMSSVKENPTVDKDKIQKLKKYLVDLDHVRKTSFELTFPTLVSIFSGTT